MTAPDLSPEELLRVLEFGIHEPEYAGVERSVEKLAVIAAIERRRA